MRDPYEILEIKRNASAADIKSAYRRMAKKFHPDHNSKDPKAKEKFAEVNSAYEILGDAAKRAQFDKGEIDSEGKPRFQGFEGFRPGRRGGNFEEFSFDMGTSGQRSSGRPDPQNMGDIFSDLFGGAFRSKREDMSVKGDDVAATLSLTLEDLVSDDKKRIKLPTGRDVEVTIPKNASNGQVIRLRGLGRPSPYGGEPGDALLTLHIKPHSLFVVEGNDLRLRLPIDLADAVLGTQIQVPTLKGSVTMKVPAMTSSSRIFRLRGKGLPHKEGAGDLLIAIDIRLPEQPSEELLAFARAQRREKA